MKLNHLQRLLQEGWITVQGARILLDDDTGEVVGGATSLRGRRFERAISTNKLIRDAFAVRKCPRSFRLAVTKKGDVFVVLTNKAGEQIVLEA